MSSLLMNVTRPKISTLYPKKQFRFILRSLLPIRFINRFTLYTLHENHFRILGSFFYQKNYLYIFRGLWNRLMFPVVLSLLPALAFNSVIPVPLFPGTLPTVFCPEAEACRWIQKVDYPFQTEHTQPFCALS